LGFIQIRRDDGVSKNALASRKVDLARAAIAIGIKALGADIPALLTSGSENIPETTHID
jgi:hypothetical protein